jgi:Uncharacterized protein conserved in archaea
MLSALRERSFAALKRTWGLSYQRVRRILLRLPVPWADWSVQWASAGTRDCADIVADAFLHQQPRYVLPCNGDLVFGMTQDYEMAFTMPWGEVERVLQGVVESHRGGLQRYPVTTFMRFEPQMPTSYDQLREFLGEGEGG